MLTWRRETGDGDAGQLNLSLLNGPKGSATLPLLGFLVQLRLRLDSPLSPFVTTT